MKPALALASLALTLSIPLAQPALAFERSDDKLFIGWPELQSEYVPGRETQVYAIANDAGETLYVLVYNVQGSLQPLGAFACNERFEVLGSAQNGFRDIECINNGSRAVLRADIYGGYGYAP